MYVPNCLPQHVIYGQLLCQQHYAGLSKTALHISHLLRQCYIPLMPVILRMHAACMQAAYDRITIVRSSTLCMPASTPCILRRRRRDADRNNTPWMNMSILGVFLRSYFSIFSHDVLWHAHSTQHRSAEVCPVVCRKRSRWQSWRTCNCELAIGLL